MEQLRAAVTAACMMTIGAGMICRLLPGKTSAGQLRVLYAMLFAVCLAAPLREIDLPENLTALVQEQTAAQERELAEAVAERAVPLTEQALTEALASHGIACTSLSVSLHIDETNCISISKVTAECGDLPGAVALLTELCGEEAELYVTQVVEGNGQ